MSSARASKLLSNIPRADKVAVEVEELFPCGQGWVWRRLAMPSEHEAWKWANRKKRSRDIRNLCIAIAEGDRWQLRRALFVLRCQDADPSAINPAAAQFDDIATSSSVRAEYRRRGWKVPRPNRFERKRR